MKIFWIIWVITLILLLLTSIKYEAFEIVILLALLALVGLLSYSISLDKKSLKKILGIVERIDLTPLEEGVKKIENTQKECLLRLFKLENELEKREMEHERKYRDLVRKILEVDNKLNTKFKLLGEVILKISKERETNS